jgi:hypothetical protein
VGALIPDLRWRGLVVQLDLDRHVHHRLDRGWCIGTSLVEAFGCLSLLLLLAYAFSWIMVNVRLNVSSMEVVNNASFMFIFR